jgi:hypothetical protein
LGNKSAEQFDDLDAYIGWLESLPFDTPFTGWNQRECPIGKWGQHCFDEPRFVFGVMAGGVQHPTDTVDPVIQGTDWQMSVACEAFDKGVCFVADVLKIAREVREELYVQTQ